MPINKQALSTVFLYGLLCILTVCSAGGVSASSTSYWQDKFYIERSFHDIALNAEYTSEGVPPVIKRWVRPLRVWMHSGEGDAHTQRALLRRHLEILGSIARLSVRLVERPEEANVRVYFAADDELDALVAREMPAIAENEFAYSWCMGSIRFNRRAEIVRGTVVIPVSRVTAAGKLESCIVEEVTQMLGLINDSRFALHTVFSDRSDDERLTGLDYLLIRLLYSPALRTGMTWEQARPAVRRQLDAWEKVGLIRRAERLVRRHMPYALAGG
ncbi:DUF2927 domain-containing protein [endosymbiont of unidentified scaly snail isolate Monju]|uniref:DUF2927 domain-containing protein n=1 Tax=endosymbiont of unidentified scaly snail isolate Monju TaxID=1248727 RepID=UPI000389280D|nr:DUF2927 domain-containing protein [endosymbiont of unidentified scaly snail isolate Monju]BAN68210.1 conserved hypothetical protein [endosymbiont of unidentified scaly snail isolate Monju]